MIDRAKKSLVSFSTNGKSVLINAMKNQRLTSQPIPEAPA